MQEASERTSSCDIAFITHNLGSFKLRSLNSDNDDKTPQFYMFYHFSLLC